MPQLSLLEADSAGHRFDVSYWSDPLHPEREASVSVSIKAPDGVTIASWYARVPHAVVFELVADVARATWEAWLFGTLVDAQSAFNRCVAMWRQEARERAVGLELAGERVAHRPT